MTEQHGCRSPGCRKDCLAIAEQFYKYLLQLHFESGEAETLSLHQYLSGGENQKPPGS